MADFIDLPGRDEDGEFLVVVESPVIPSKPIGAVRLVQRDGKKPPRERNDRILIEGWDGPKATRKTIDEAAARYVERGTS